MAATRKTSSTMVAMAALTLTASLLFLAGSSEAACPSKTPMPSSPTATPAPATRGSGGGKCPVDTLKLGVCADVLGLGGELTNLLTGSWSKTSKTKKKPCCQLIAGLADLDAAVCLCTAIKANVLGLVDLDLPLQLGLLVNHCGKKLPAGFHCSN